MLKVEALQASYGQSQVLFDVGLEINRGEVITLLGRNGMAFAAFDAACIANAASSNSHRNAGVSGG